MTATSAVQSFDNVSNTNNSPLMIQTVEEAKKLVMERGLSYVKVGVFDVDGLLRGKYMRRDKFFSALDKGFGFCDVIMGWDMDDQLYDNVTFTGWHTGYPDAKVKILPHTARNLPLENDGNGLLFLGELENKAAEICPRATLQRVVSLAQEMGYNPTAAFEYEFFVFDETPDTVREKNYQNLKPITPGNFGYSVLRSSVWSEFYEDLLELCEKMNFALEGLHTETGPGVLEASIDKDNAMEAADKAALFKTFCKVLAQKKGLMVTFMAKWSPDYPGQSGHIHLSMKNKDTAKPVFHDPKKSHNMSDTLSHFVAGQQQLMPELLSMISPTVNSFTRMIPGFWAPTHSGWGVENRTCALRVIPGKENEQRVEYRLAAADANPYIALSAALGAGLYGIKNKLALNDNIEGNAYEHQFDDKDALPTSLAQAAHQLKNSQAARTLFGDAFVDHYAASRDWEQREFNKHITDWELKRYFESI